MSSVVKNLLKRYLDPAMLRWAAVGITTAAIDYILFITLFGPIDSVFVVNLFTVVVATSFNYLCHHKWTFKSNQQHSRSGAKYLMNLIFWWLISSTIIKTLVEAGLDPKVAKLVPFLFIVPINYFVLNKIVFKKNT
jgi:putative flippase GtrA